MPLACSHMHRTVFQNPFTKFSTKLLTDMHANKLTKEHQSFSIGSH